MRAKIKFVPKIFLCIFRCIFTYMWKSDVSPHNSMLTKNIFLFTLKAKYQNDPNNVKKCHILQTQGTSKYLLTSSNKHPAQLLNQGITGMKVCAMTKMEGTLTKVQSNWAKAMERRIVWPAAGLMGWQAVSGTMMMASAGPTLRKSMLENFPENPSATGLTMLSCHMLVCSSVVR